MSYHQQLQSQVKTELVLYRLPPVNIEMNNEMIPRYMKSEPHFHNSVRQSSQAHCGCFH